jgi:hypothetical protein
VINPTSGSDEIMPYVFIPVNWGIKLIDKTGAISELKVLPETLESADEATGKLKRTTIRGKTRGGGEVELTVETARKSVEFKIRLIGTGTLDAANAKAAIFSNVQNYYQKSEQDLKGEPEKFSELIEDDWLRISRTDRSDKKLEFADLINAAADDITGSGIQKIETEINLIKHSYTFTAGKGAAMSLSNDRFFPLMGPSATAAPVHKGYDITFTVGDGTTKNAEKTLEIGVE